VSLRKATITKNEAISKLKTDYGVILPNNDEVIRISNKQFWLLYFLDS
jgi:hypothetical protein